MEAVDVDWLSVKTHDYYNWGCKLNAATINLLRSSYRFNLAGINDIGCFHHISHSPSFTKMRADWESERRVPEEWVAKGHYPGIWTALFSPHNTYGKGSAPIHIIRLYFKEGYFVYDRENKSHRKLWKPWSYSFKENPWRALKNSEGESLQKRMDNVGCPYHKLFYEDNRFGAFIGYHDYISTVVILPEAIEDVEFLELHD